jgi:hypothetical protein
MSWGFVEGMSALADDEALYDGVLTTPAGHTGVTFVASTGDYGAAVPQYPAFSPNVVAVGGTTLSLNSDSSYNSEVGWGYMSSSAGGLIGSGGGISQFESEPAFQEGVQSTGYRSTPDVAFLADPAAGAWIADSYNLGLDDPWVRVGGTSLSAPAWAGLFALANQSRVTTGKATLGTASPTEAQTALYTLPVADYHGVTSGSNGYSAGAGYNLVTGLGTPVGNLLIADLAAYDGEPMTAASAGEQHITADELVLDTSLFGNGDDGDDEGQANARMNGFATFNAEMVGNAFMKRTAPATAAQAANEPAVVRAAIPAGAEPALFAPSVNGNGPPAFANAASEATFGNPLLLSATNPEQIRADNNPKRGVVENKQDAGKGLDVLVGEEDEDLLIGQASNDLLLGGLGGDSAKRDASGDGAIDAE